MFPRCTNINYYVPIRFYLCVAGFTENSLAMRTRQEQQRGTITSPLAMLVTTYSTISTLPILVIPAHCIRGPCKDVADVDAAMTCLKTDVGTAAGIKKTANCPATDLLFLCLLKEFKSILFSY